MSALSGLIRRLVKGSGLTSQEGDANLDKIEQAISDLEQAAASFPSADNSTLELVGGTIREKDLGTTTAKLADGSATLVKLASDSVDPTKTKSASSILTSAAGASAIDWSLSWSFYTTLTENTTYSFANTKDGQSVTIAITQHAAAAKTVTWPAVKWSGGVAPTMTPGLSKIDIYTIWKVNGLFFGAVVANCS